VLAEGIVPHRPAHRTTDSFIASQPDKLFLIETMLWNGAYPFIELHLDRLADSADYSALPAIAPQSGPRSSSTLNNSQIVRSKKCVSS